nr:phospholipase D-like domain-containing protein [Candidatus Sigynarchaeota archaeon]
MDILTSTLGIAGKIESLITNAKNDVYLISPYIQIDKNEETKWESFSRVIRTTLNKNIPVHVYARKDDEQSGKKLLEKFKEFQGTKLTLHVVEKLHAKLYYNKDEALICSLNMYRSSLDANHEIGVVIKRSVDTPEKMEEIENFIHIVDEDSESLQFENERQALKEKSEKTLDKIENVQFLVLSKGYKWFKVLTPDGYENKILVEGASIKEGKNYIAKAKLIWNRTAYGVNVELTGLHDIVEVNGYCIVCRKPIKAAKADYPMCYDCNKAKDTSTARPQFCKRCGQRAEGITPARPLCPECYAREARF